MESLKLFANALVPFNVFKHYVNENRDAETFQRIPSLQNH